MKSAFKKFDVAEHLTTEEDILRYLEACIEENGNNATFIASALGHIARARNMSQMARNVGVSRPGLYKALSGEGNPSFELILKVADELGLRINFAPRRDAS